jgi:hypothetical protein
MQFHVKEGSGTFHWTEGYSYQGYWENGYLAGNGSMTLPDSTVISGEFNQSSYVFSSSKCCSKYSKLDCFLLYKDGSLFTGECQDDKPNGYGIKLFGNHGNDLKYYGSWEKGYLSGLGLLYHTDERVYFGNFTEDKMTGSGLLLFNKNNSCYRVEMLDDQELKRTAWAGSIADCQFEVEGKRFVNQEIKDYGDICKANEDGYEKEEEYKKKDGYEKEDGNENEYENEEYFEYEWETISKLEYNITHCQLLHGNYCNKVYPYP